MDPPEIFLFSLVSFVGGILSRLFLNFSQSILLGIFIFLFFFFFRKEKVLALLFLIFIIGSFRVNQFIYNLETSLLLKLNDANQEVTIIGKIIREPEIKQDYQKLTIDIKKLNEKRTKGKILVYAERNNQYVQNEKLKLAGKLITPPEFEDFNFREYLKKQGIISLMYYPRVEIEKEANWFYGFLIKLKQRIRNLFNENLPYPENQLLRAIVLGDKKELPDNLKQSFNKSGMRHITAISGMHITILMNILIIFLIELGFWRKQAGIITILFIFLYILFIGFQPSAIRAAIIGLGLILAQILGRLPDAIRFLLLAAAIMLLINPFLFYDIGFQLSFLAATGINYLTPFFNSKLKRIPKNGGIRNILAMTFAAQIFTLPLLLYHFGYFSLLSPVSNLLVVPLIPFVIGLGFLGIIIGLISSWLSFIIFAPLFVLLWYIVFIANLISKFSFFALNAKISLALVILYYIGLFFVMRRIIRKRNYWLLEY